jgi:hypothetical protein
MIADGLNIIDLSLQERINRRKLKTVTTKSRITKESSIKQEDILDAETRDQFSQRICEAFSPIERKRCRSSEDKFSFLSQR